MSSSRLKLLILLLATFFASAAHADLKASCRAGDDRSITQVLGFADHYDTAIQENACPPRVSDGGLKNMLRSIRNRVESSIDAKYREQGLDRDAPILIRAFKYKVTKFLGRSTTSPYSINTGDDANGRMEVWVQSKSGEYVLLHTYPICMFTGVPGPKIRQNDEQLPEGFFEICPSQMKPDSHYHLAMDIGYNSSRDAFTHARGASGGMIEIHGGCASLGCMAMTDDGIEEIYSIVERSLNGNENYCVPVHVFPFEMTPANYSMIGSEKVRSIAERLDSCDRQSFWENLQEGYDWFEANHVPPKVSATGTGCDARYVFGAPEKIRPRACALHP